MIEHIRLFLFMAFVMLVSMFSAWATDREGNGIGWFIGMLTGVILTLIYLK